MTIALRICAGFIFGGCLAACSKNAETADTSNVNSKQSSNLSYSIVETFNVGENVFVRTLAEDRRRSELWVGTSVGAMRVDVKSGDVKQTYTRENGLANEYVFAAFASATGDVWLGTNGGGVSQWNNEQWKTYFPLHGLADYWVYSFAEQRDGSVWIGTWAGLSRFDRSSGKFTTYLKELANEWVYGLAVDSRNGVWIGTEGGINRFDGKQWQLWTHKDGLGAPNDANLPFSTNTGLGTRQRHDLSVMMHGQETYNPNYVFALLVDGQDHVWAGTWGGGVARYNGKEWKNYTTKQGLAGNIVYSVALGTTGDYWFGTQKGLSHFDGSRWETYDRRSGLLDENVYAVVVTANGDVWAGTRNGVAHLKKSTK